jgi:hypothetical protein
VWFLALLIESIVILLSMYMTAVLCTLWLAVCVSKAFYYLLLSFTGPSATCFGIQFAIIRPLHIHLLPDNTVPLGSHAPI